ncbi:probable 3-deoxy-D-manno-octulosonic acid transferase, mitochondrial isoform X1 [Telopea speciosissima]|uniref:probable 3-deoxy-D-manno-octulosonic acid transferase, mitochondrial isoform X1 n=1 Tax=Telopea speciosissima TaxID=54955 RepID=UPI001CC6722D|nr:probable 3-deoxy-D-manno-octulosonic acid transferase, mitochondrial isoform X1 [Telopea speciosissima]
MAGEMGKYIYMVYRTLSYGLSPLLYLHVQCRRLQGLEHPLRWRERFGRPSLPRPSGPLVWFHAVSLGEGMAAIPIIKHCIQQRPDLTILMTTTTNSAFNVIKDRLPLGVIYQFAPLDTPAAMDAFLGYWDPSAIFLIESELWPNLVLGASKKGIVVALLNARMSSKSFKLWSAPIALPLISLMLSRFSLIAPISTIEAIQFQLLQARPFTINFAGDLKYAVGHAEASEQESAIMEDLQLQLANRPVWMAASIHKGEEEVMLGVHKVLVKIYSNMLTIIVPRHPEEGRQIAIEVRKEGLNVVLRSSGEKILPSTNVYVVDTLGELSFLYRLAPIAVIGGSFLPGLAGHNISEAAAAGCAVLTGHHVGHFSHMVLEMQRSNPLSVMKVSGKLELVEALKELFSNAEVLEARRMAAKQAFFALSSGIITNFWNLIDLHVFRKAF